MIPCDSEYSLIFCNSGVQIYQGIRSVYGYLCDLHVCKWNYSDGYICWNCVLSNCSISCVSCVIDSIGLPCAFGLVIFWYTIADSWRCRKYHIANSKLSVLFDSVQKTESFTVYIRYKGYQFESIIYVPFSWYHYACAHCIVLMWHLNY